MYQFDPSNIDDCIDLLQRADQIIGHNVIKFDLPALTKVYPGFTYDPTRVFDTLVMSRLIWPNLREEDAVRVRAKKYELPLNLIGSHSLKAWGIRLCNHKADYEGGWDVWSQEMQDYMVQDVRATQTLFDRIVDKNPSSASTKLEHDVAFICAQQERHGWAFDKAACLSLVRELHVMHSELSDQLQEAFPPWEEPEAELFVPKVNNKARGYVKGEPIQRYKSMVFNPGSRHHIANRLTDKYAWKPKDYTDNGQPQIDEKILGSLAYPEAQLLARYFVVQKALGQSADGNNAWLKYCTNGRIHGGILTNGAVTGRATHSRPNIAQVPKAGSLGSNPSDLKRLRHWIGAAARGLFIPTPGLVMVGADASGLELRTLAHYLAGEGDTEYGEQVVSGDIHTANQEAAGLETRDQAKTFIYAYLYGAGDAKLGSILDAKSGIGKQRKIGKTLRATFEQKIPALGRLSKKVKDRAESRGYLIGLDGRRLHVRSAHSALNTLLQSAGAIICKQWMCDVHEAINKSDWKDQRISQVGWIHDELQFECSEAIAPELGELCKSTIRDITRERLGVRVPLAGDAMTGKSWAETH